MLQLYFQHVSIAKPADGRHIDPPDNTPQTTLFRHKKAPFRNRTERGESN